MKIGIDGNEANVPQAVGVSVYTQKLLQYFSSSSNSATSFTIFLKRKPLTHMPPSASNFNYRIARPPFLWSQFSLPLRLAFQKNIDVFFSPAHYAPRYTSIPSVVTVHDLSYFFYPQEFLKKDLYKLINWTDYSVKRARKIICVSNTTKKDLITHYKVSDEKIEVVYNGFEKQITKSKRPSIFVNLIPGKYILYVGTLQPRKNIPLLIEAFALFKKKHPEFRLVITGRKGWLYKDIFKQISELNVEKGVYFTDFLPDEEVAYLYQEAFCFVLPSLYEGFGIPLLEAMSYGCPVISSDASSLPEVGGDACLYFNPTNKNELLSHLEFLASDKKVAMELIAKGRERVKSFSWEKCAKQTLKVLKEVVK